jgi:PPE-repeat protein
MTAPVWMASPPEVHSALLSSGPGPGSLLAAAGAWTSLSAEYASAAGELTTLLGAVRAGAWEGPSAEQYVSAHVPYLAWLSEASANSAGVAAQHEIAAAAYAGALAAMPTLPELATNHGIHGVLIATNFFGINTIPIALNEADYARMWIQAATTMASYQAVSGSALASAPRTTAAPSVLKANNATAAAADPPSSGSNFLTEMFNQLVQLIQNPGQTLNAIIANPSAWFPLLFFIGYQAFFEPVGWTTWSMLLSAPFVLPIVLGLGINALLGQIAPAAVPAVVIPPVTAAAGQAAGMPVAGLPSSGVTPATTTGSAPAPGATSGAGVATPAAGGFAYVVGGIGPDDGPGPTLIDRKGAKAPGRYIPAAAAVGAVGRNRARARRRRRAEMRDYADEFADMNIDVDPDWGELEEASVLASDSGAGSLGFVGTVHKGTAAEAAGLATLSGNEFGGGPSMPMVPATWEPEAPEGEGDHR